MFKLAKHTGLPLNGMLQGFAPATALQTRSAIVSGTSVQVDASGDLDVGATGVSVAGILAVTAGASVNAAGGNEAYTGVKDHLPFIPVNKSTLIEADIVGTLTIAAALFGVTRDITSDGKNVEAVATVNGDFKIYKIKADDGTNVTKVLGYFTNTEDLA